MRLPENTPSRSRVVQGDIYADYGMEDFSFDMPRPFVAEDFFALAEKYGIDANGCANTLNQVLAENLGNNLAQKIKAVHKRNLEKGEEEELEALPGEEELAEMIAAYDFSGVRTGGGGGISASPMEKALLHYARSVVRTILKENGYAKLSLPAPVTVAKKDEEPKAGQISYEAYESEVYDLAEGNGAWAENEDYAAFRESYVVAPAEAKVAADEKASVSVSEALGLFK